MTTIKEKVGEPDNPMDEEEIMLRHYRWDEEDLYTNRSISPLEKL